MAKPFQNIITVSGNDGRELSIAGGTYRVIISGQQTGGTYAVIHMLVPPGGGPGPHAHPAIQETFYVLEGEVEFESDGGTYVAAAGAFIHIPVNGPVHRFKNKSDQPARLLCTVMPAGLDAFFVEVAQLANTAPGSKEDMQKKMEALAAKYGQQLFPPDYFGKRK